MLAHHDLICPDCGNFREDCSRPDSEWWPQKSTCYASADLEVFRRRLQAEHKREPGLERHPLDGLRVWVSDRDLSTDEPERR